MTALEAVPIGSARSRLHCVDAASLSGKEVPERRWHVPDLIPARTVTLLNGDGGTGKSLLALQLAVATVGGGYWVGRAAEPGSCVVISAEDDVEEIHRRLADVAVSAGIDMAALVGLTIVPLAGEDALLASPEAKSNVLKPTPLFRDIESVITETRPALVILDTLADLFGGEENQRAQARQFVGMLRGLCLRQDTTALLLAHPSLSGMASGSGSSGSTAWNNSVRSRLYLDRVKSAEGAEDDPDVRVLRTVKANYGRTGQEIKLRWRAGVFSANAATGDSFSAMAAQSKAERAFLDLLSAYEVEGRPVSAATGHGYAPAIFAKDPRADGVGKFAFIGAMNSLFATGRLRNVEHGPPSRRTRKIERVDIEQEQ